MGIRDLKINRQFFFILIGIVVALAVISRTTSHINKVLFKKKPEAARGAAVTFDESASPVKAFRVKVMDFKDTLPCIGNVRGFKEVDLKFQVAGIIESFNFEEGEKVQEGDIIASLVQRDALLKLKYAEIELNKNQKLFDIGAISSMRFEQAKLEYESSKSELDKTNIYAMSNGLLGSKLIDVGNYVTPNDKVGIFVNIDKVYADFSIIEKDSAKISLGQRVEVFADSYPNKSFGGVIDMISPIIEGRSRTQNVKVELDNKEGLLKPGMFIRASIATYEKKEAIVVPVSGLKKKENEYFAYLINKEEPAEEEAADKAKEKPKKGFFGFGRKKREEAPPAPKEKAPEFGTIEVRPIKAGYMTQDLVEVADGIQEGDLIIIEAQEEYKDKQKVEILEVQEGII
jgi:membrane fusion protein (multidrug efflux system)